MSDSYLIIIKILIFGHTDGKSHSSVSSMHVFTPFSLVFTCLICRVLSRKDLAEEGKWGSGYGSASN